MRYEFHFLFKNSIARTVYCDFKKEKSIEVITDAVYNSMSNIGEGVLHIPSQDGSQVFIRLSEVQFFEVVKQ